MTLTLTQAIGSGVKRVLSVTGLVVFALITTFQLIVLGGINTIVNSIISPQFSGSVGLEMFTLPVSLPVAVGITASTTVASAVVFLISTRLLTRKQQELSTIPRSMCTRRIGWATISGIGMSVILAPLVLIGMTLIIPGLFLAVSFQFAVFFIGVEDARAISALRQSWRLASGNRWRLLAILIAFSVAMMAISIITSLVSVILPVASEIISVIMLSAISVALYGVVAEAYLMLRDGEPNDWNTSSDSTTAADPA